MSEKNNSIGKFLERRHPEYQANLAHWNFLESSYKGERSWFSDNIFRYLKEGEKEYQDRVARAYRFNHTREVVDLVNKYIFKALITRNEDDAPEEVKVFWKRATRDGRPIEFLMRSVSRKTSALGRCWLVVDSTNNGTVVSKADEKNTKVRVYSYIVRPQDVLNMSIDDFGELNWILIRERVRDDEDPIKSTGEIKERYRLWTREGWALFEIIEKIVKGAKEKFIRVTKGEHGLGEVPVVAADHIESDEPYVAPGLINDIAYLDRAATNYLSNLDAIIQDQTFSQLVLPAQGLLPGEDGYDKLVEAGTKRIFTYDGEHGAKPEYIAPDPKQAQVIVGVINKIISEIYHTIGMAGERTKQDNALGIDNSSGVAKAYDFERMNAMLASKADALELVENRLVRLVKKWHGVEVSEDDEDLVKYPDNFDTRSLYDEFEIGQQLALLDAPDELRRLQMETLIEKLYPRLSEDLKKKLKKALEEWPADPMAALVPTLTGSDKGLVNGVLKQQPLDPAQQGQQPNEQPKDQPKPTKKNRQGQVTKDTPSE